MQNFVFFTGMLRQGRRYDVHVHVAIILYLFIQESMHYKLNYVPINSISYLPSFPVSTPQLFICIMENEWPFIFHGAKKKSWRVETGNEAISYQFRDTNAAPFKYTGSVTDYITNTYTTCTPSPLAIAASVTTLATSLRLANIGLSLVGRPLPRPLTISLGRYLSPLEVRTTKSKV